MEALILVLLLAGVVGLVLWVMFGSSSPTIGRVRQPPSSAPVRAEPGTVVLDVEGVDPANPYVQQLVEELGSRALAADDTRDAIEVVARDGTRLGRVERPEEHPPPPQLPPTAGARRGHGAVPRLRDDAGSQPGPGEPVEPTPHRPLADRHALPESVRTRIADPDDLTDVVRAILEAGGHAVEVRGDLLIAGDDAIVVLGQVAGNPTQAMNAAYLHFRDSGCRRGVVISMVTMSPRERTRRELLAPELRHVGPDAVGRMAAAVAIGVDPLRFVLGFPTVS